MSFFTYLIETEDLVPTLTTANLPGTATLTANYGPVSDDYPLENIQTSDISTLYKTGEIANYTNLINIDLGASLPWNFVALINHNFDPSIQITVRGSNNPFFAFSFSQTMTFKQFDMFMLSSTMRTERYVQILIIDSIATPHSYSFGRLMVGPATTLSSNFSYDWRRRRKVLNRSKRSDVNSRMVNHINRYKELVFSFSEMTDAQLNALTSFTDALYGDFFWCFLVPNPDVNEGYVMTLSNDAEESINRRSRVGDLGFSEESRGVRITL